VRRHGVDDLLSPGTDAEYGYGFIAEMFMECCHKKKKKE
jgi:hypothetical protein